MNSEMTIKMPSRFEAEQIALVQDYANMQFAQGCQTLILDFGMLTYIDSQGLTGLIRIKKRVEANGASLQLVRMNDKVRTFFAQTHLDKVFTIVEG